MAGRKVWKDGAYVDLSGGGTTVVETPGSTTVTIPLMHGTDSVRENWASGSWGAGWTPAGAAYTDWIDTTNAAAAVGGGLFFRNVPVPRDATVLSATLTVTVAEAVDDISVNIFGELDPNPDTFDVTTTMAGRAKTTASASWVEADIGTGNSTTVDVTDVVQELVGQGGWGTDGGNDICFIAEPKIVNAYTIRFDNPRSIGVSSTPDVEKVPSLVIEYTFGGEAVSATGGTITRPGDGYVYHKFTGDGTFDVGALIGSPVFDILLVGGGGGGGDMGGGGAGGYLAWSERLEAKAYTVTIGDGGAAYTNGDASSFAATGYTTRTARGGGGAKAFNGTYDNTDVGSGAGAHHMGAGNFVPSRLFINTADGEPQGWGGGYGGDNTSSGGGGGGGGASEQGGSVKGGGLGGDGGDGVTWLDGNAYAGGGGGGNHAPFSGQSSGGAGGGGAGADSGNAAGAGTANTGGGGGGHVSSGSFPGLGGSGVAIIRYPEGVYSASAVDIVATGGTTSTPGDGYKYHDFTDDGTFEITDLAHGSNLEVLMVGGGGGGGTAGGAGGQVIKAAIPAVVGSYTVTIGDGSPSAVSGGGPFPNATASKLTGPNDVSIVALPGQGGGYFNNAINFGYSYWHNGGNDSGAGPTAQNYGGGNNGGGASTGSGGGAGAGGAGGGSPGNPGGAGGDSVTIWGYELSGGGGGGSGNATGSAGGAGGGTVGGDGQGSSAATAPTASTGSGGGGGYTGAGGSAGTAGSDGRVIIRYPV